ncbi:MAG TPA: hypothetical protein PK364_07405 [Synergistaceae bacterium]|nr:hypothetical protein [Synergistaceae bacterium]HPJ25672.1 hypothetical protein [Synergistaceae bacterium]HPQ36891.1 hypothetical protein [Synergistaceae bacterium]
MFQKNAFEDYQALRENLENRCRDLCKMYAEVYFESAQEEDLHVINVENDSQRLFVHYAVQDIEETLTFPVEYLWRTNEEVGVLMNINKEAHIFA